MKLSNKIYNIVKYFSLIVFPAGITLAQTIASTYNVDISNYITVATAINTFLGTVVGIASTTYNQNATDTLKQLEELNKGK